MAECRLRILNCFRTCTGTQLTLTEIWAHTRHAPVTGVSHRNSGPQASPVLAENARRFYPNAILREDGLPPDDSWSLWGPPSGRYDASPCSSENGRMRLGGDTSESMWCS